MNTNDFLHYKELIEKGRVAKLRIWSSMVVMLVIALLYVVTLLPLPLDPSILSLIRIIGIFMIPTYSILIFFRVHTLMKVSDKTNLFYLSFFEKQLDHDASKVKIN